MRGVEQSAELPHLAGRQRGHRLVNPGVLGDHVADARVERLGQRLNVGEFGLSQAVDAEQFARLDALGAPLVVTGAGVRVAARPSRP